MEKLISTDGKLNGTDGADESFDLTGANDGTVNGIAFSGIDAINAGTSTGDSVTTNALTALTESGGVATSEELVSNLITVSGVENLVSTDGNLNGTAGADESFELTGANGGTVNGIAFSGIDASNAGTMTGDRVTNNSSTALTGI